MEACRNQPLNHEKKKKKTPCSYAQKGVLSAVLLFAHHTDPDVDVPLCQTLTEPNQNHDVMMRLERSTEARGDTHVAKGQ